MIGLAPLAPPSARASGFNPVAKLGVIALVTLTLVFVSDPLTPALMLAVELGVLPLTGIRVGLFLRRTRLLLFAVFGVVVVNTLFSDSTAGNLLVDYGPFEIHSSQLATGLALGLRVAAVAVPGVIVFATTDPTDLADSLVQQLRVSPRFAIGALAAFRLLPLLVEEWQTITMARRARGIDAGWNPVTAVRLFASTMFALLVGAIRRGTRLATAMDARGFDSGITRTIARPQRLRDRDWLLLSGSIVACLAVLFTSIALEQFQGIF